MNKFTDSFWKYSICLLIVGVILVTVGGLSVSRTTLANKKEMAFDMSYKEKITIISNENMELKKENEALKQEKESNMKKIETGEAFIKLSVYIKEEKYVEAAQQAALVDVSLLPPEAQAQFEAYKTILEEN